MFSLTGRDEECVLPACMLFFVNYLGKDGSVLQSFLDEVDVKIGSLIRVTQ